MTLHGMIMKHASKPVCDPWRTFIRILFFLSYWRGDEKVVRNVWAAHFELNVEDFKLFVVNGIARMLWHWKLHLIPSFHPACCSNHKPLYFECIVSYHSRLSLKFFIFVNDKSLFVTHILFYSSKDSNTYLTLTCAECQQKNWFVWLAKDCILEFLLQTFGMDFSFSTSHCLPQTIANKLVNFTFDPSPEAVIM